MTPGPPQSYGALAEAAWRWVLAQVRWDDGPWIPGSVTVPGVVDVPWDRDGMHSGVGGLAYVLAEIRLARQWTTEEKSLADAIVERVRVGIPAQTDCTFFDGLVSTLGVLTALEVPGPEAALARLAALATPDGWPQTAVGPPRYLPDTRVSDATLGTAGVLLAALWARRRRVAGARDVAERAVAVLMAEAETSRPAPTGASYPSVSAPMPAPRCRTSPTVSRASPRLWPSPAPSSTVPTWPPPPVTAPNTW